MQYLIFDFSETDARIWLNFVWMFLGSTPTKFVKLGWYPYLRGIMGNCMKFWSILRNISMKPLTRNYTYTMIN